MDNNLATEIQTLLRYEFKDSGFNVMYMGSKPKKLIISIGGVKYREATQEEFLYLKDFAEEYEYDFDEVVTENYNYATHYLYYIKQKDRKSLTTLFVL